MKVIIAEKPSVARNIADALNVRKKCEGYLEGENYLITWAFGHLLQLYDAKDYDEKMKSWSLDKFPFIPKTFKYKIKSDGKNKAQIDAGAQKQIEIIKHLITRQDVESIISATDYDREGQIIADELFLYLKEKKPIYRMLLNEWTPDEVKKGIERLRPNEEMQPLQDAGMGRQWADWLIGINLTSVATVKYAVNGKRLLNIGRVLLPTLKIVYDRDMEIEKFESSTYYKLIGQFKTERNEIFEAVYYEKLDEGKWSEKFEDETVLKALNEALQGKSAVIATKEVEKKKEYAPFLFNLSNLQGYVTSKYKGWTSDKVLKVAQSLYEKKYITYPRTGSIALEESLTGRAQKVLEVLKIGLPYEKDLKFVVNKRIFDNTKVESHSAIIPTYIRPSKLSADEQMVYDAVKNRFLMQFLPVAEFEETRLSIKMQNVEVKGIFQAKGKVQLVLGWQVIEKSENKDTLLPFTNKGEEVSLEKTQINAVKRKPPKPHTEKTLLKIMETCGKGVKEEHSEEMMASILSGFSIGTPATRAETIKKLKDAGYIKAKGKSLICTPLGKSLVEGFPVKELFDLEYTGRLEKTLSDIEKGKYQKKDFLQMIEAFTVKAVSVIKMDKNILQTGEKGKDGSIQNQPVGICPLCGNLVLETEKAFGCSNWKAGCKYTIWKNDKFIKALGKEVTRPMVELLLKNGKVGFRNLKSRKGTTFAAYLKYVKNEEKDNFKWEMEFI